MSLSQRSWVGDDLLYVNLADNLRKGSGLTSDILIWRQILSSSPTGEIIYRYQEWETVSHPIHNVGFIYPLFLAVVFMVFSAHPPSLYFVAAIANTAVTLLVIIAVFLFALKLFDRKTALLTSIAAALLPSLYWYSMQSDPLPLFFLWVILTFIVASKASGIKGWLLVGALVAVAHLTHGLGILIIATFLLWCLIERRFKDSLFLMISYISLMLPWFIRNQLLFGDFSLGTGIPASTILGWFKVKYGSIGSSLSISATSNFTIFDVLSKMYNDLTQTYNMGYIALLLFFAFCGLYWYKSRRILAPQFILLALSLLGYVYTAFAIGRVVPETRYLMCSFLVLLPLSIYGFINIVFASLSKVKPAEIGKKVSFTPLTKIAQIGIILLLLGVMITSLIPFAANLDATNKTYAATNDELRVSELLKQQNPETTVLLTNEPFVTYIFTGLKSLYLHSEKTNITQLEWLINRYNVSYVVIYRYDEQPPDACLQLDLLKKNPGVDEIYLSQKILVFNVTCFVTDYVPPSPLGLSNVDIAILFEEMEGSIAKDSSNNDKIATLFNDPSWGTQGKVNKIVLNGIDQYATLPDMFMAGNKTYIAVVSPNFLESEDTYRYIFTFRASSTNYVQLGKGNNAENNTIYFQQRGSGSSGKQAATTMGFNQNDVLVIVCTYDDTTGLGSLYVNGVVQANFTSGKSPVGSAVLQMGRYDISTEGYWKGWIGPFIILSYTMNADQVAGISENLTALMNPSD